MIKDAHKNTSLETLKQIKQDNCIAKSGQEYCKESLENLIHEKQLKQFDEYYNKVMKQAELME